MFDQRPSTDVDRSTGQATAQPRASHDTFVCREQQISQLRDYLRKSAEGSGSFVIISGEAGTGKTFLVEKFTAEAASEGAIVVSESFNGTPAHDPYRPFHKIIATLSPDSVLPAKEAIDHSSSANLAANRNQQSAALYALQTDYRLAQQRIIEALIEVAQKNLLIINLQDAHLAPLTAWQFIHFFSENLVESKILLTLTLRQDGKEANPGNIPEYADVLQRMNREGLVNRIELARFTKKEIRQYLHQTLKKTDFSSQFVNDLYQVATGLPDRIHRLLQIMISKDLVYQDNGIWFDQDSLDKEAMIMLLNEQEILPNFDETWQSLDGFDQQLLEYGSLFEETFDHQTLSDIFSKPRLKTLKALVRLQQLKFLIDIGEGQYQFKYPTIAARVRQTVSAERRQEMHSRIAWAIEQQTAIIASDKTMLLAYHFSKTEERERAFHFLCDAGSLAMENFAFVKARDLLEQALNFCDSASDDTRHELEVDIYLKLIWLERALGDRSKSLLYCNTILEKWPDREHQKLETLVLIQKGLTLFQLNEWQQARECFEACFANNGDDHSFDLAMAHYGVGNVWLETSDYQQAELHYRESLKLLSSENTRILKANLYNNLGIVENVRGNRLQAIALYSNCVPIYKAVGDHFGLARVYLNIGISYAHEKDWKQANQFYGRSLGVSDALGLVPLKSIAFLNRAQALIALKNFSEASEYNSKAYRLLERLNDRLGMAEYYKNQGILEREQGDLATAEKHLESAKNMFATVGNKLGIAESEFELGLAKSFGKKQVEMLACLQRSAENYRELGLIEKVKEIEERLQVEKQTSLQ